ncbi:hypothetical protein F5144DRAFT_219468 [Chaetomium tenue]|uniref:Uncharacterized protein n=1 Tax=Chaetomium tenue TaxID=1854479 RepID=A0ACB7P7Q3_9PEZI|nr:hypothetical protein F5144DRAFT_219468 [Chaetomium globosum]
MEGKRWDREEPRTHSVLFKFMENVLTVSHNTILSILLPQTRAELHDTVCLPPTSTPGPRHSSFSSTTHISRPQTTWCSVSYELPFGNGCGLIHTMGGKHHDPVIKHHCPQCRCIWSIRCFQRGHYVYCKVHAAYYPRLASCLKCENAAHREERSARNERETKRKLEIEGESQEEIRTPRADAKLEANKASAKRLEMSSPSAKLALRMGGPKQTVPD